MNETKQKGLRTELQCQLYFTELGYNVSVPLGEDCRYDMIIDINGILKRVQAKTCHENDSKNGIVFATRSTQINSKRSFNRNYNSDEVDYYATFYNGKCYLVRVLNETCNITLSYDYVEMSNGTIPKYLSDYEAEKQIEKIRNGNEDKLEKYVIIQYDLSGKQIAEYNTIADAARCLGNINKNGHIADAIKGNRRTAFGYKWEMKIVDA